MKLGIFDSGIGGEAIAAALQVTFPNAEILTVNDREHMPYGSKSHKEVVALTESAIQPLLRSNCDVIILACNTATAQAIDELRTWYPDQKFIGIEPMIKTAATLTKSNKIVVCATPSTLASDRYHHLLERYAKHIEVVEPDCSDWAYLIENNQLNRSTIEKQMIDACSSGADVIVLGCTHYHWIKDLITDIAAGKATIIEPTEAIGRRVEQLLKAS